MKRRTDIIKDTDYKLIVITLLIVAYGLLVLKSATLSLRAGERIIFTQYVATGLGLVLMVFFSLVDYRFWKSISKLLYIVSVVLLILTLVLGDHSKGATSWLDLKIVRFQPAEIVKVWLIIALAAYLEDVGDDINNPLVLLRVLVFAFFPVLLVAIQPDFGTAIVFTAFILVMLIFAGISWKLIAMLPVLVLIAAPILWTSLLKPYQKRRVLAFLKIIEDNQGQDYQYNQGKIAIGSGKFFGKGIFQGSQNQYNFIPEKHNDFIFPVLVEELGFFGGSALIVLYGLMLLRFLKIAKESTDRFGSFMVVGFMTMILVHIWENIGMTIGLMPITGIPLPFFSAGGTFQMINLAIIGLILSVSAHKSVKYY